MYVTEIFKDTDYIQKTCVCHFNKQRDVVRLETLWFTLDDN